MSDLLSIYWFAIIGTTVLAGGLSLLGAQLASRDRAMQTLCVGQGAMLGVLLGLGLGQSFGLPESWQHPLPFLFALAAAASTFLASEQLAADRASGSTHFAALFALLLAGGYLCSALFPALENHMSQKYFGDLATIDAKASWVAVGLGSTLLIGMSVLYRGITRDSFDQAILGVQRTPGRWAFTLLTLAVLSAAVQLVGFLFTTACLFIPTAILSLGRSVGLVRHLVACGLVAMAACGVGFAGSLWFSRIPTTPFVVLIMILGACFVNFISLRNGGKGTG